MRIPFRLTLAQINTTVGDFQTNFRKISQSLTASRQAGSQLVAFPELAVTGYPPEDLLFRRSFLDSNIDSVKRLARLTRGLTALVGFVDRDIRGKLYNAVAVLSGGEWVGSYRKVELPNYGVFDEKRYFERGERGLLLETGRVRFGISICEDMWLPESFIYRAPYRGQTSLILNVSASPYHVGKWRSRLQLGKTLAKTTGAHVAYLNLVGGQDELVFDGGSFVVSPEEEVLAQARHLEEDLLTVDLQLRPQEGHLFAPYPDAYRTIGIPETRFKRASKRAKPERKAMPEEEEVYRALVLGTRDYVEKNGFKKVLIGLSGGIDSALVAALAVDALGPERVLGVTMPSRFSSKGTYRDAVDLAKNLDIKLWEFGIEKIQTAYLETLRPAFAKKEPDSTEENLQARVRGNLLMALSNKFGHLVLTTGNKSEMATGYCTLYGDMAGGFAVIKDVPKTLVYRLARWRNRQKGRACLSGRQAPIPESTLRRAPTAELRANQKDADTLPPYKDLDPVLKRYIEEDISPEELIRAGFSKELVRKVVRMVDRNEYKRRQSPPGVKISPKAFGRDRRLPITNRSRS